MSVNKKNDPFILQLGETIKNKKISKNEHWRDDDQGYVHGNDRRSVWLGPAVDEGKLKRAVWLLIFLFLLLGVRIFYLQVVKGSYYRGLAEGNRIRILRVEPVRGIIYDDKNKQVVQNVPSFALHSVPVDLPDNEQIRDILEQMTEIISIDVESVYTQLKAAKGLSYYPISVSENIPYEQAVYLKIKSADWPGFQVVEKSAREYVGSSSLSHVLGYVGIITEEEYDKYQDQDYQLVDTIGKSGIEKYYESELRGQAGKKNIEVDSLGKELKIIAEQAPIAGNDLYLYIDAALQQKSADVINEYLQKKKLSKAALVIIDPQNGGIKTMLSFPQFDNNIFKNSLSSEDIEYLFANEDRPLINRAIAGQYPSGSTIKPLVAAAALQEEVITEWTSFNSVGGIYYDVWWFPDWKTGGHGQSNVVKSIAQSVNTFFYMIGIEEYNDFKGLGLDRMVNYMHKFGLGNELGVDLPGEVKGLVPTREWKWDIKNEVWYPGDTMHMAIGQGDLLITPLQLANYIAAIANNGILYRPRLLKERRLASTGEKISVLPDIINQNMISKDNLSIVKRGMREAVTQGSARQLNAANYQVAAKTGTAQVGGNQNYHSWTVGFGPLENSEIAWAILIENGGESTDAAVPIMKEILDWYFAQKVE